MPATMSRVLGFKEVESALSIHWREKASSVRSFLMEFSLSLSSSTLILTRDIQVPQETDREEVEVSGVGLLVREGSSLLWVCSLGAIELDSISIKVGFSMMCCLLVGDVDDGISTSIFLLKLEH